MEIVMGQVSFGLVSQELIALRKRIAKYNFGDRFGDRSRLTQPDIAGLSYLLPGSFFAPREVPLNSGIPSSFINQGFHRVLEVVTRSKMPLIALPVMMTELKKRWKSCTSSSRSWG